MHLVTLLDTIALGFCICDKLLNKYLNRLNFNSSVVVIRRSLGLKRDKQPYLRTLLFTTNIPMSVQTWRQREVVLYYQINQVVF